MIAIDSLTRRYGLRRGVDRLSLSVPEGVVYGFLGPNGAGKTTTIRVLLGFLRPTSGSARLLGLDCWRNSARIKQDVGYVPGDLRLYPWMNGRTALRMFGSIRRRDLQRRGRELAEELDLDLAVRVAQMSRGTRQKLGLVLALAHEPKVLLLDEPTTGLDPLMQERFRARLRAHARGGRTVFFSSHTLAEAEQVCDRVAIVREGRLVADQSLEDLRRQAGYVVTVRLRDAAAADIAPPVFLESVSRIGLTWTAATRASAGDLVAWLNGKAIDDLAIERPDLEALFRRFYEVPPAKGTGP